MDGSCNIKYLYENTADMPKNFQTGQIKQGEFWFLCIASTGGVCVFESNGNELWGRYTKRDGGRNNGVFRKVD